MADKTGNTSETNDYDINGTTWRPVILNLRLSGRGNYILAKLGLFNPNIAKSKIAKDILEKELIKLEATLSKI